MNKSTFLCVFVITNISLFAVSELERIIPPEIKNDAFYQTIYKLAQTEPIATILEIGSSSGEGSTEAFVSGISKNPSHPTLFCMEVSKTRFAALKKHYQHLPYVKCYNVSSVPLEAFPKESEVSKFYNSTQTSLRLYGLKTVLVWLKADIDYVKNARVPQTGIYIIKTENNIKNFDMVLIDGSEFTGMAELKLVYGARFILLDDITAFKNYANYKQLLADPDYALVEENKQLRNGYAIFKRKN